MNRYRVMVPTMEIAERYGAARQMRDSFVTAIMTNDLSGAQDYVGGLGYGSYRASVVDMLKEPERYHYLVERHRRYAYA